jgi:hypothetical protein
MAFRNAFWGDRSEERGHGTATDKKQGVRVFIPVSVMVLKIANYKVSGGALEVVYHSLRKKADNFSVG